MHCPHHGSPLPRDFSRWLKHNDKSKSMDYEAPSFSTLLPNTKYTQ